MTMEEQRLNKKLAEWAFPDAEGVSVDNAHIYIHFRDYFYKELRANIIQPFTKSLDACFEHLIPKLNGYGITQKNRTKVHLAVVRDKGQRGSFAEANRAALALCLAIEKLIDKGVRA